MQIKIVGGVTPSGKWVFFPAKADFSKIDETKLQHFTFEVEAQTTKHGIAANGIVFEVLERLGLLSPLEDGVPPGTYDAAMRLSVALLRCTSITTGNSTLDNPKASNFFDLPPDVLRKFQIELRQQDELTKDDFDFFTKPATAEDSARPAEDEPDSNGSSKTESDS